MLKCENISLSVGKVKLIEGISFSLERGSFTALVGKNGSGKSTLCECICALRKYAGNISICGEEIFNIPPSKRAKKIAFLPQILPSPSISVKELCELGRSPYLGLNRNLSKSDNAAVSNAIKLSGLCGFEERLLPSLSGGERQRAFLAMMLAQDADILVLDEPTAFLDTNAEAEYISLLHDLTKSGKTLLVTLHNLSLAAKYADKLLVLNEGKQIFFGAKSVAIEKEIIENTFSVRKITNSDEIFFFA